MEKKYVVSIKTPNRMFVINGRQVRTPFTKTVNQEQMMSLKNRFSSEGVMNYTITEYVEPVISDVNQTIVEIKVTPKVTEPKKTKIKSSTLNTLIGDTVNS